MKHLKKLLSIFIFAIIIVGSMFTMTACNLVVKDKTAYYNQTVATFEFDDKTLTVSMNDLNSASASYGYSRYSQGYYSNMKDCINDSLKYHIQKTLLMNHIAKTLTEVYSDTNNELYNISFADTKDYDWNKTLNSIYKSNNPNALEIRSTAYDAIMNNINSYAEEILKDEDRMAEIESKTEESSSTTKTEYESKINIDKVVENGIEKTKITKKVDELHLFNKTDIAEHFAIKYTYDEEVTNRAYNKYINYLQQEASSQGRSTKIEDVILYQENQAIKNAYQNKLLELYQYYFDTTEKVVDKTTNEVSYVDKTLSVDKIIEYYKNQYTNQLRLYEDNIDAYRSAVKDSKKEYMFYNNNSGKEYIQVNHILFSFNEEQKAEKTRLDNKLKLDKENAGNNTALIEQIEKQYDNDILALALSTKATYEVDGEKKTSYVSDVINEIRDYTSSNELSNSSIMTAKEVLVQKAKNFEDMMYKYNQDPGNMNADFYYCVNVNDGVEDQWEAGFTEGAIELYNDYNEGDVLVRPVVSSYGVHFMFYAGMVHNLIEPDSLDSITYEMLLEETVNPASDKTILEYLYDKVEKEDYYNNFVSGVINQLYNSADIKLDEYKYKNLWS